jgi:ribosomal protein S6E (S10)
MGGQDKQGFPMKQGVLTNNRVQVGAKPALS